MNAAKSKTAWLALLAAGGLYAWNNRDKIQGWLSTQRDQLQRQIGNSSPSTGAASQFDNREYPARSNTRGIYD